MATAPFIEIYSLNPEDRGKLLEELFTPAEFYRLARFLAIAFPLAHEQQGSEQLQLISETIKRLCTPASEALATNSEKMFAWYCACSAEAAFFTKEDSWKASPEEFKPEVRYFLGIFFFVLGAITDPEIASFYLVAFVGARLMLKAYADEMKKFDDARLRKHCKIETAEQKAKLFEAIETCRERIARLVHYCSLVANEKRAFSFDVPESATELALDIEGLQIRKMKGGGVLFGSVRPDDAE